MGAFALVYYQHGLGGTLDGLALRRNVLSRLWGIELEPREAGVALYADGELDDSLVESVLIAVAEVIDTETAVVLMETTQLLDILAESKEALLDDGTLDELDLGLDGTEVLLRPYPFFKVLIIVANTTFVAHGLDDDLPAIDILPPLRTITGEDAMDLGTRHARLDDSGDGIGEADIEHALAGEEHLLGEELEARLVLGGANLTDDLPTGAHGLVVGCGRGIDTMDGRTSGGHLLCLCTQLPDSHGEQQKSDGKELSDDRHSFL